jgi:integrase/recombinase XerD
MLDSNLSHPEHRDGEDIPFRGEPIEHAYARELGGAYFVLPGRSRATLHALPPAPLQFPSLEHLDARVERLLRDAAGTRGLRPTTIQWARSAYAAFRQHVKSANCETEFLRGDLGAQCGILKAWIGALRGRGVTHVSVNSYWRGLRCLFRWLSEEEGTANPLVFLPAPRAGHIVPRALTETAAVSVLQFVRNYTWSSALERTRNSVIVGLLLLAGLRLGEVVKLLNGDLDEETGGIRIARGKGQGGGKDRTAYMSPQLRGFVREYRAARHAAHRTHPEFLTALHANRAVGRAVVTNLLRLASESTGVRVSPHMLRHTYATLLRQRGTQDRVAMELLGHSSLAMLQRYSHIFDGEASAAADRLHLEF